MSGRRSSVSSSPAWACPCWGSLPWGQPAGGAAPLSSRVGKGYGVFFHLRAVPHHRPLLRHPPLRHSLLHGGGGPHSPGAGQRHGPGDLFFPGLFRRRAGLFLPAQQDSHLGGKSSQPPLPLLPWDSGGPGPALSHGAHPGVEPMDAYATGAFFTGFREGYQTMDALASLAFGIVVVNAIRDLGVKNPTQWPRTPFCRSVQLPAHGPHLPDGHHHGHPEPGALPRGRQRRRGPGPHCRALLRHRRRPDPGGHRYHRLPENRHRPGHQLLGDLCADVPQGPLLRGVGR